MSLHLPATSLDLVDTGSESGSESDEKDGYSDWISDSANVKQCKSLFEDKLLASATEAIDYDKGTHGFDLNSFCQEKGTRHPSAAFVEPPNEKCFTTALDFHARVRLINYIRKEVWASSHYFRWDHSL